MEDTFASQLTSLSRNVNFIKYTSRVSEYLFGAGRRAVDKGGS